MITLQSEISESKHEVTESKHESIDHFMGNEGVHGANREENSSIDSEWIAEMVQFHI